MRSALRWIVAALALLLAGVLVDTARAAPRSELRHALKPYLPPAQLGLPIQAAVLLQRADCEGNLRMLDLMHRPGVHPNMQLAVMWYVGAPGDSMAIREALPSWTQSTPLRFAPKAVLEHLRQLGHNATPTLVVLDQQSRIRLVTQSPRSLREFAGLRKVIEGLTWIEEL